MKKAIHTFLISLLLTVPGIALAQLHKDCSAEVYNEQLQKQDPQFARNQQRIESFTQNLVQNGNPNLRTVGTITIPVVVHVVYNTSVQNISDAQILSQIDALNEDFQKLNADTVNIPSVFRPLTGNMQIEFCLAKRDPSGNTTTGITRTQTSEVSFSSDNKVKFNSTGGKDGWNRDQYLNIWVCYLGGNLGGYAQYPGGSAATDGVVVTYTTFGRTSNVSAPYNKGRVTTHEVGHWLNLRHIWGSSACGDDFVADTPQQEANNFFCPVFPKLSNCAGAGPNGDMFMNHMDYTYDACKNMFSVGQVARAHALFAPGGSREPLLNSLGCIPVGSSSCSVPNGISSSAITDNAALISWTSTNATSYALRYRPVGSSSWTTANTIATSIQLTSLSGLTTYEYQVQSICVSISSSFSPSFSFTTLQLCPIPTNLTSTSVTTNGATLNWTSTGANSYNIRYRISGSSTWTNTTSTTNSKVLTGLSSGSSYEYQVLSVCSTVNSAFTASSTFTTQIFCATPTSVSVNNISNNMATVSWVGVGASAYNIRFKVSGTSTWTTYSTANASQTLVNLLAGTTYDVEVQAVCSGVPSSYSNTITFTTTGGTVCNPPSGLNANSITSSSATFNWTSTNAISYGIRYKLTSSSVWTNTSSSTNSVNVSGLNANSSYEFQVYSVCSSSNSGYSASSNFTTLATCNVPTGLNAGSITTSSATVSWTSSGANSYQIRYRLSGSTVWTNNTSTTTSLTISGLAPSSTYEFQVSGVCGSTSSTYTSSSVFTTLANCNVPSALNATSITSSSALLSWTNTGAITYNVRYRVSGSSTWTNASTGSTSMSVSNLNSNSAYEFQVNSVCGSTSSAYSGSYTFITLINCNIPSGLSVGTITANSAVISWTSTGATSYNVRFRISGSSSWINSSTSSLSMTLTGLSSGSLYEFQISSVCGSTSSAYSASANFTTSINCSVPTGLNATNISTSGVTLNWTSTGAVSYNVRYRVIGASTWITTSSNQTNVSLGGLASGSQYEYQVESVCASSTSGYSSGSTFTTLSPCNPPSSLSASNVSQSGATLSWTSTNATSYNIRYRVSTSTVWINTSSTTNSVNISGLVSGSVYNYQVSSVCGSNSSAYTNSSSFTTLATCNIPSGLLSSSISTGTAVVSWTPTSASSYNVRYRIVGSSVWSTLIATSNSIQLTNLSASTNYEFQVNSVCGSSSSSYSAMANFTTSSICPVPTGLSAIIQNPTTATISWNANISSSYLLRYRIAGTTTWIFQGTTSTSYTISSLSPATDYEYQVRSDCGSSTSAYAAIMTFSTTINCLTPSGLSASNITSTTANLSWSNNSASYYTVRYKIAGTTNWTTINAASSSVNLSGLSNGTSYEVQVMSICSTTQSAYSASVLFSTISVCTTPLNLSATSIDASSISLSWNTSLHSAFNIRYSISGLNSWTLIQGITSSPYLVIGLTSSTSYDFQIQGICADGSSGFSNSVSATTQSSITPCSNDSNEPNDNKTIATRINPNSNYYGLICDSNDQDWFEFKIVNSFNNVRIDLFNLPADYDIELFNSNLVLVVSSKNRGQLDEMLIANNLSKGATYFVKISGYNGATDPTNQYTLYFNKSRSTYSPSGNFVMPDPDPARLITVYPNPTLGDFNIVLGEELEDTYATIRILDQKGMVYLMREVNSSIDGINIEIQRNSLTAGIYFVEITTAKNKVTKKLVIY